MEQQQQIPQPHVVILPFPVQGHVKPMFKLAELLCHASFHVTFVNSEHNHKRLLVSMNAKEFQTRLPRFRFESLPDGLPPPEELPRNQSLFSYMISTIRTLTRRLFRDLVVSLSTEALPPTCIIADGIMSFAIDVAEEFGIPLISFRTFNASCTWIYFHLQKLIQEGQIPFPDENMDQAISCIPGLESIIRRRDLPSICRVQDIEDPALVFFIQQTTAMTRASGLILNTFQEFEEEAISGIGSIVPNIYPIGPLHALLKTRVEYNDSSTPSIPSDGSLRKQDRSCIMWLDSQPSRSVIYVSFGSIITLTGHQLLEFWHGLINSGQRFLWVIRSDLISQEDPMGHIPPQLLEESRERGSIVRWAPQEEVLAHRAIGGFLTHCGWNSTLESIFAGVPMIGWPLLADQQVNSRCISELWKIGFDMKDTCHRSTVEKMVRDLMEDKRHEIAIRTDELAHLARKSIEQGGSSYCNLERLINDIKSISL